MQAQGKNLCFLKWHKQRHKQDSAAMRHLSRIPESQSAESLMPH